MNFLWLSYGSSKNLMHLMHLLTFGSKLVTSKKSTGRNLRANTLLPETNSKKVPENRAESQTFSGRISSWIGTHVIGKYLPFVTSPKRKIKQWLYWSRVDRRRQKNVWLLETWFLPNCLTWADMFHPFLSTTCNLNFDTWKWQMKEVVKPTEFWRKFHLFKGYSIDTNWTYYLMKKKRCKN